MSSPTVSGIPTYNAIVDSTSIRINAMVAVDTDSTDASRKVTVATASTVPIGVCRDITFADASKTETSAPVAGETCSYEPLMGQVGYLLCDGTTDIAAGDRLKLNSSGQGVKATPTAGDIIVGIALAAYTTNSAALVPVQFIPPSTYAAP